MTKVLVLGFSVTAERGGYADLVREGVRQAGIDVHVCGVGGVNPLPLPVIYEGLLEQHGPFGHVFLEIATSVYGTQIADWWRDGLDVLYDLFSCIQASGAEPALVNLYRDDFKYPYHVFDMVLESLSRRFNVPLLDLGASLLATQGVEFCRSLLRDVVHTTPQGSQYQAEAVSRFILDTIHARMKSRPFPQPLVRRRAVPFVCGGTSIEGADFHRSGLRVKHAVLPSGSTCAIKLPSNAQACGISFLSGPLSGELELRFESSTRIDTVQAFDEHCYYERYNYRRFSPIRCETVTCTQLPGIPSTKLRKGEPNLAARVGKPVALHYTVEARGTR
jgi:hypothetical protein